MKGAYAYSSIHKIYDVDGNSDQRYLWCTGGVWPGDVCGGGDHLLQEQGGGPSQANILTAI